MIVEEHVSLAPLTTFKIGGPARYFVTATSLEEVVAALGFARERALPVFILGGGSNILIADEGFPGLVLRVQLMDVAISETEAGVVVTAGAGVGWDDFVAQMVAKGYPGFECLSGIPGTVGGAVVANAGAYGAECSDAFVSVQVLDLEDVGAAPRLFTKEACDFSYHDSYFSKHPNRYVILTATFVFHPQQAARATYKDNRFTLSDFVAQNGRAPTLSEVRDAVIKVRAEKGVLQSSYRSAGSFFHMPYVSRKKYEDLATRAQALDAAKEARLRPWAWEQPDGSYKVAPGFLLEYTPFQKGYTEGAVGISPKHTLSVITSDGACARDVAQLAQAMHDAVEAVFALSLEREVKYIGAVENN